MQRTHTCGDLDLSLDGKKVVLNGWVHRIRDHGGIYFVDLRDRYGVTQLVVDTDSRADLQTVAADLKLEHCLAAEGTVRGRPGEMVNPQMKTGDIEVKVDHLSVLSTCDVLPFMIDERTEAREDLRLKFRFLDLRSLSMQRHIRLRHEVTFAIREYLTRQNFFEIETPTLIRSTPEGARDFLVPSRLQRGKFYALPQSPQIYKQLLMVSGFDRYYQIAHCFRDEDARGDRQIEHTQIDIEMSFVSQEDVFSLVENMLGEVFAKTLSIDLTVPFSRISYQEAMNTYGSDKPDIRFPMKLVDISSIAARGSFEVFRSVVKEGGSVKGLVVPGGGAFSRKKITGLEEVAKSFGAKGMAWMKVTEDGIDGGIARFYSEIAEEMVEETGASSGDLILMIGGEWKTACQSLGAVRRDLVVPDDGEDPSLKEFRFCWITDFPLFERNEEEKKWDPAHHMFTMPQEKCLETLEEKPGEATGYLYDLVCNGVEVASGSIRIHDPDLQRKIFRIIGLDDEETEKRFGFLLNAFRYGPPPHGGIAPGLDRIVMLMAGEKTIRDVIAFPKNTLGVSPMDDCPSAVDSQQLNELGLSLTDEKNP